LLGTKTTANLVALSNLWRLIMGDGDGGAVAAFVTIGVVYLFAEFAVAIAVAIVLAMVLAVLMGVLTLVWVIQNPIPTFPGWVLFVAGGITLLLLPGLFAYAVPLHGHSRLNSSHMSTGDNIVMLLVAAWYLADLAGVAALYRVCREFDFSRELAGPFLVAVVVSGAVTGFLYASALS
jgi:hypothetical protein